MSSEFYWVAVAVTTIVSAARITRLLTWDDFPPSEWLRQKYMGAVPEKWNLLAVCGYCMSFWVTGAVLLWGWGVGWDEPWWLVNGIFAASYLAAIVMEKDGDEG